MKQLSEYKKEKWLVAVSGGADSMALLDMAVKLKMNVIVAHMNYCKRDTADRDMHGVENYCQRHGVPFFCRYQTKQVEGNFQAFARKERYAFFHELIKKHCLDGVLVAHHLDDAIETYLMQKQRGGIVSHYGISQEIIIQKCRVIRPLLNYTKQELKDYCINNEITYYDDESNFSDDYTRNKIRHSIIDHMTYEEKINMQCEMEQENHKLKNIYKKVHQLIKDKELNCGKLKEKDENVLAIYLYELVQKKWNTAISQSIQKRIVEMIYSGKRNWQIPIGKDYVVYEEYGKLCMDSNIDESYEYIYDTVTYEETPYFTLCRKGKVIEGVSLKTQDYPIKIRNAKPKDEIQLRLGTKKLNRWFIDRKIPKKERKKWPVIENAEGKVIFVAKIGCDIEHFSNNPDLFVIK